MVKRNVTEKLIERHCNNNAESNSNSLSILFDQTLCQDATGTLVMLILEAMNLDSVKTEVSAQYVDHNLLQEDNKNPDDHLYLLSAAKRFGLHYSRAGNGISHPLHMIHFGKSGAALIGSDSHTCAAGCLGMLSIGAGGTDVALAMAGEPVFFRKPKVLGVELQGKLQQWVSAKDIILEMLRRYNVSGGRGFIIEYFGEGLQSLSAMDRHVIANMGAELGATTTVFPSDNITRDFLKSVGREKDWIEISADNDCHYDSKDTINLSSLEPLIAKPSSPGNVVPVSSVEGESIYQAYIGSSANPGFRDFAIAAEIVDGEQIPDHISFDINPSTKQTLMDLSQEGYLNMLLKAGARLHQAGCNGCIGMGQAPATEKNSLRTTPRNFPGRSGTVEDKVWLCSPETAAASALNGKITDPRKIRKKYPVLRYPDQDTVAAAGIQHFVPSGNVQLNKGPNIKNIPSLEPLSDSLDLKVLLHLGDNISTDEILPAGAEVLPFRSNIPRISDFAFMNIDKKYVTSSRELDNGHAIIAGDNYGQGSSREHAALALRYLGLSLVIAQSYARIHWQNLINFGILPCIFLEDKDQELIRRGEYLQVNDVHHQLKTGRSIEIEIGNKKSIQVGHDLDSRQKEIIRSGGVVPWMKNR